MVHRKPITFIDVETTGTNAAYGKVIEVGVLRFEYPNIVKKFHTLINPEIPVDPFIFQLTGISEKDLENAPTFYHIKDELLELFDGAIFAAHNVRFDYSFIKEEMDRCNAPFDVKKLCTVKLARALYPEMKLYNLDAIIEHFGLKCKNRHRAFDDAKAICEFFQIALKNFSKEEIENALAIVMKKPSLPPALKESDIDNLPEKPGVYMFYAEEALLYIGKSTNIKERVASHFMAYRNSPKEFRLTEQVKSIEVKETGSELAALLLESELIKKQKPIFNRKLRHSSEMIVIKKTVNKDGYFTVEKNASELLDENKDEIVGVFRSEKQLKEILYDLVKDYSLCPKLLNIEKTRGACFYYGLGICKGACTKKETVLRYNMRFIEAFHKHKIKMWPFKGPIVIKDHGAKKSFIVDKWRLIEEEKQNSFDLDTYKILVRYILNPTNQKYITSLS